MNVCIYVWWTKKHKIYWRVLYLRGGIMSELIYHLQIIYQISVAITQHVIFKEWFNSLCVCRMFVDYNFPWIQCSNLLLQLYYKDWVNILETNQRIGNLLSVLFIYKIWCIRKMVSHTMKLNYFQKCSNII